MMRRSPTSWPSGTLSCVLCFASLLSTTSNVVASDLNKTIDLWMNEAPLTHVIHQLAELSGGTANISGALEDRISGRFYGTVAQSLETLSQSHDVLFDLQDSTLHATSKRAHSEVSMVMPRAELNATLNGFLQSVQMPGNEIAVRDELVKLSGHPDFVQRTARLLAAELVMIQELETKVVDPVESSDEALDDLTIKNATDETVQKVEITNIVEQVLEPAEPGDRVVALDDSSVVLEPREDDASVLIEVEPEKPFAEFNDTGSDALLADIAEEAESQPDDVKTTDSIQWVTDIPGFSTF